MAPNPANAVASRNPIADRPETAIPASSRVAPVLSGCRAARHRRRRSPDSSTTEPLPATRSPAPAQAIGTPTARAHAGHVADDPAAGGDEESLREAGDPVLAADAVGRLPDVQVVDAKVAEEAPGVVGDVLLVESEEQDARATGALPRALEPGRLLATG